MVYFSLSQRCYCIIRGNRLFFGKFGDMNFSTIRFWVVIRVIL